MGEPDPERIPRTREPAPSPELAETLDATQAEAIEADPLLGRRLRHFRIEAPLGRGGMGAVYRAWDESLERPVALKVLLRVSGEAKARFMREARAQARIRHPNVVPIHFVGESDDGTPFLVMDLVEGESLEELLAREGSLPVDRALDLLEPVVCALEAGTEHGMIHRDIKPSNILIDRQGHVHLADFGLAKRAGDPAAERPAGASDPPPTDDPAAHTRTGALVGTPAYLAPEQADGGELDHRTDVYALGVTLYEMLVGQRPFRGPSAIELIEQHRQAAPEPPRALDPHLPAGADELVLRMLRKDPSERPGTYAELRDAMAAARPKKHARAAVLARASALLADFVVGLAVMLPANALWGQLGLPLFVLALGLVEGRWGTTLGKRLLGLRTVGPHGEPTGYGRAIARSFLKLWGPIVLDIQNALLPATWWREASGVALLLGWIVTLALVFFGRKQPLHDRLAGTRVVHALVD